MKIASIIYFSILLIGILTGAIKLRRLSSASMCIWILLVYVFIKEVSSYIIARTLGHTLTFYTYTGLVDFILTIIAFMLIPILKSKNLNYILIGFMLTGIIIYCLNLAVWKIPGKAVVDSVFKLIRSVLLVAAVLLLFFSMTKHIGRNSLFQNSEFWFGCGVLIFYAVSIFYWGVYNYRISINDPYMKNILRPLFEYANYTFYSLLAITLYFNRFTIPVNHSNSHNVG